MTRNIFENDLVIFRKDDNRYTTEVRQTQLYGGFMHGGFAASLLAVAGTRYVVEALHRDAEQVVVAYHIEFLKLLDSQEIELVVEQLSVGSATVKLRVSLNQQLTLKVVGDITITSAKSNTSLSMDTGYRLSPPPASADLARFATNTDRDWIRLHIPKDAQGQTTPLHHWNLYLHRSGPTNFGLHDEWFSLAAPNARITNFTLPVIADTFIRHVDNYGPYNPFRYEACVKLANRAADGHALERVTVDDYKAMKIENWTATQYMNLEIVRQLPAEGVKWIFMRAEAKAMRNRRLVVEVTLWDEEMQLVAIGQVVDVIVPAGKRSVKI